MTAWEWLLHGADGSIIDLTAAHGRRLSVRLNDSSSASFSLDARHEEAHLVRELVTDVQVICEDRAVFRGRVAPTSQSFGPTDHDVQVNVWDYRELLERRYFLPGDQLEWTQVDQAQIAWDIIAHTQAKTGGDLGITRGTGQVTGRLRDRSYEVGKSRGEALQQLAEVLDGFEWEVDGDLRFNVGYPQLGQDIGYVLEYPGAVLSGDRGVDPNAYANVQGVAGDPENEALTPVVAVAEDLATALEGRWEAWHSDHDLKLQDTISERALWMLSRAAAVTPTYRLRIDPRHWGGPDDMWIGDTVAVQVNAGRVDVDTSLRVVELDFAFGEEGRVEMTATVGARPRNIFERIRRVETMMRSLSRR